MFGSYDRLSFRTNCETATSHENVKIKLTYNTKEGSLSITKTMHYFDTYDRADPNELLQIYACLQANKIRWTP